MQIVLPSNVTTVSLPRVNDGWVFSVAGNTARGSTGLTRQWLCKYDYDATPTEPQLLSVTRQSTADSVIVRWAPLHCDSSNTARILRYVVHCTNNETGINKSVSRLFKQLFRTTAQGPRPEGPKIDRCLGPRAGVHGESSCRKRIFGHIKAARIHLTSINFVSFYCTDLHLRLHKL